MSEAEKIAIGISAMMNTSGGVLEVQIDTGNLGQGSRCDKLAEKICTIITTQENWTPNDLFENCVKPRVEEKSSRILFFVSKTEHLVSHCFCAYKSDSGDVKPITDHYSTSWLLRCDCTDEHTCQDHKDRRYAFVCSLLRHEVGNEYHDIR